MPGILRLLQDVHTEHGKTAWRDLFTPAVTMADDGFEISPRLAAAIADAAPQLKVDPNASAYFLNPDGGPKTSGTRLTNPAYSKTLGVIASDPQSFYTGDIARAIVAAAADTVRRPHPEPDDARGPVRLHRQEARAALRSLPRQGDLRHAAAVVRRHCGGGDPGHARAFPDGASTNPPTSTSTEANPR